MTWKRTVLVVANVTANSDELLAALLERAGSEPVQYTLIVPATAFGGGRAAAEKTLAEALQKLRAAKLTIEGEIGNGDPVIAVTEAWDPKRFDEIVISTLPMRFSKWLHAGLPERVAKITGAPVTHVVSEPRKRDYPTVHRAEHEKQGVISPLTVLGWGGGGGSNPAR